MNKAKRRPPIVTLVVLWVVAVVSIALVIPAAAIVRLNFASYRSCSVNSTDLLVQNCGKHGVNLGDVTLIIILLGTIAVVISLFTHAWRLSRRPA